MYKLKNLLIAISVSSVVLLAGCNSEEQSQIPNPVEPQGYTVVIMPDTQKYSRYRPELFEAQTEWIANNYQNQNIVFTAHLGDLVDIPNAEGEWQNARQALAILEMNPDTPYSVLAGNHDLMAYVDGGVNDNFDDERNPAIEPYLKHFSVERQQANFDTFQGSDETGFNTYHIFKGGGREYLNLALDWRPSEKTLAWAQSILDAHSDTPTIITTHQLMNIAGDGETAVFTDNGAKLWDQLIKNNDQVFMAVNGHHHGEAMMVAKNAYGRDVTLIVVDYQSSFWGGNGMMQLIHFVEDENKIKFRSFSPWVDKIPEEDRLPHDKLERWKFEIDFNYEERFSNLNDDDGSEAPGNIDGVIGYWTFDDQGLLTTTDDSVLFRDLSGNGNVFQLKEKEGSTITQDEAFLLSQELADIGFSTGSVQFNNSASKGGFFLSSQAPTMINGDNAMGVLPQYTVEAIVHLSEDWTAEEGQWGGIFNHQASKSEACNFHNIECSGADSAVGLNTSSLSEFQWVSVSQNGAGKDNWSWSLEKDRWYHVVITNDGEYTTMYVDNSRVMRTSEEEQHGLISIPGEEWTIGINSWDGRYGNLFRGSIAEVRIADRVLSQDEWLINQ
ncbi:TPA: LamG-like jellyroll fold domain-containing protein [Vibrio alginolyticus]|nr:serine/threonine protein phosphatase [Vibrio alginolyticus]